MKQLEKFIIDDGKILKPANCCAFLLEALRVSERLLLNRFYKQFNNTVLKDRAKAMLLANFQNVLRLEGLIPPQTAVKKQAPSNPAESKDGAKPEAKKAEEAKPVLPEEEAVPPFKPREKLEGVALVKLPVEVLTEILAEDTLNVSEESQVVAAIDAYLRFREGILPLLEEEVAANEESVVKLLTEEEKKHREEAKVAKGAALKKE